MQVNGMVLKRFVFGAGILALWMGGVPVSALVVTPARTEMHMIPGSKAKASLMLTNEDNVPIMVDMSKKDWFIPPENKKWTVDRWLKVHGSHRFILKPGESRTIDLSVKCPKALTGEVVGMVSFLYRGEQPSMVTPMISVSVYLIAKGHEKVEGVVSDILVRDYQGQVNVSAKIRSTGNVHIRPGGTLAVLDAQGREMAVMPVESGSPTYPGTENVYSGTTPSTRTLSSGQYTARVDLTYQKLRMTAVREFTIGSDGKVQMGIFK